MDNKIKNLFKYFDNQKFDDNIKDYEGLLFPADEINNLKLHPNQYAYISNARDSKIIYASPSVEKIIGYTPSEISYQLVFGNIHPDDLDIVLKGTKVSFELGQSGQLGVIYNSMQINYRFKHKNGNWMHIMRTAEVIRTDKCNKMFYVKSTCTDITDIKSNNIINVKIYKDDKVYFSLSNDIIAEKQKLLTKTEKRIVDLLIQNLTSTQIAEKLHVSRHTIDTHRRNILKKLELDSTKTLLFYGKQSN